jgi:outer membrane protein OmpA-like peptidoglycan-associated protein
MRVACILSIAALTATLMLTACAPATRVVMLPQPGHDSIVEVTPRAGQGAEAAPEVKTLLLTKPYQGIDVNGKDQVSVEQWTPDRLKSRYGALLTAQPPAQHSYLLYFEFNGTQLTSKSATQLDGVIAHALARPGNEIVVTGYTDSVGTAQANDQLSLQRAQVIRQAIIARGFDPARIYAVGRGARDSLILSGHQADKQKDRRVEITVR